jgi:ferredoxin
MAIGQKAELSFIKKADGIEITPHGTIKVDPDTLATTREEVFAGGDVAFGPRIIIEGVANGKHAARSISTYLEKSATAIRMKVHIEKLPIEEYRMPSAYEKNARCEPSMIELGRRTGINEVEEVFTAAEAVAQADRCLQCHVDTIYDSDLCVICGRCVDVCPEDCLQFVPLDQIEVGAAQQTDLERLASESRGDPVSVLLKDNEKCIRCGLCALRCPTEAMTMERFSFNEGLVA